VMTETTVDTIRLEAMLLSAWPDRQAALTRLLDIASSLMTEMALGERAYDQESCDTMREVGYMLWLFAKERPHA
jgi:hypothetical protein